MMAAIKNPIAVKNADTSITMTIISKILEGLIPLFSDDFCLLNKPTTVKFVKHQFIRFSKSNH